MPKPPIAPEERTSPTPRAMPPWLSSVVWLLVAVAAVWLFESDWGVVPTESIAYSDFKQRVAAGLVDKVVVEPDTITATVRVPATDTATEHTATLHVVRVEDAKLIEQLEAAQVEIVGVTPRAFGWMFWLLLLVPVAAVALSGVMLTRRMGRAVGEAVQFGQSPGKVTPQATPDVTFDDVAGCDEAKQELREVVDFLANPARYQQLGAKIPRGVLLVGPPGTGKTLMARAVAGESKVPFFSLSGSDFVEMFVGVGAARVRSLFEQAKRNVPCIVFIDELDAIGRRRGVHLGVVNDEREQTLNALLVELDGFAPNSGIILLAATNRPDVLDPALLRPGRFDRQVVLDAPDVEGRLAILGVHVRKKPLAPGLDLRAIAQASAGLSGADLANAVNEAALFAARRGAAAIAQADLEAAFEKIVAGPERHSRHLRGELRRRIATHEVGHALVAHHVAHGDPVHKVSIVPRGHAALGYTMQLPTDDHFLATRAELEDKLAALLGGRAAEELVFGESSTGTENDLAKATSIARQMVTTLGMSEVVGLARVAHPDATTFVPGNDLPLPRDCSEATAREIDEEVKRLLDHARTRALEILAGRRADLDRIVAVLLERETLDRAAFEQLAGPSSHDIGTVALQLRVVEPIALPAPTTSRP